MSKKKSNSTVALPPRTADIDLPPAAAAAPPDPVLRTIGIPLGRRSDGYISRHVDVQLDPVQRTSLSRLLSGLRQAGERLDGGKPVGSNADAVRWLLERLANGEG